jgi:hypothetical protein
MLEDSGFTDITIGPAADTFGGATGENNARSFEVYGYTFLARKPERAYPAKPRARASVIAVGDSRLFGERIYPH